ncbi:hypothetical protein [Microcoleus sp. CAWBG640]|uniref:hypothetical protein n=1 Tax=Microcoleus sp. CAWBG640 TaxID=2841653 RepID=UPI00312B8763
MSDIAILKEMIQESATVPLEDSYGKGKKQVILKEPPPADYSVEYRFISIGHISISKGKTRNNRSTETNDRLTEIHNRPDKMLEISRPNKLQFNHLIYGR